MLPNVGLGELGLIMLLVLIVMGPKRLPDIARSLGKAYRTFQTESRKATSMLKEGFDDIEAVTKEIRNLEVAPDAEAVPPSVAPPPPPPGAGVVDLPDDVRAHEDT